MNKEKQNYLDYQEKVKKISQQIEKCKQLITTNRSGQNIRDLSFKKQQFQVNTKIFNQILSLNTEYVDCESCVTVGKLNRFTIPHGKIVPSMPEGPSFTVGGCFAGLALGSNSYLHGFFGHNVIDFDIILGNGEFITNVSQEKEADLYYGIGGTYGTLGTITRVKLKLIPCQPYVKVNYFHYNSFNEFNTNFKDIIDHKKHDFLEAFVNKKNSFTIVAADFIDKVNTSQIATIKDKNPLKERKKCLYAQIANKKKYNYLHLIDYLERWSSAVFWGKYLYSPYKVSDYILMAILGSLISSHFSNKHDFLDIPMYAFHANKIVGEYNRDKYVLQTDIGTPLSKLQQALKLVDEMSGVFPIWICPILDNYHPDKIFCTRKPDLCKEDFILDIGIYGAINTNISSKKINIALKNLVFKMEPSKVFFQLVILLKKIFGIILIKKNTIN
jgi:Delta24-sterol reductase